MSDAVLIFLAVLFLFALIVWSASRTACAMALKMGENPTIWERRAFHVHLRICSIGAEAIVGLVSRIASLRTGAGRQDGETSGRLEKGRPRRAVPRIEAPKADKGPDDL